MTLMLFKDTVPGKSTLWHWTPQMGDLYMLVLIHFSIQMLDINEEGFIDYKKPKYTQAPPYLIVQQNHNKQTLHRKLNPQKSKWKTCLQVQSYGCVFDK